MRHTLDFIVFGVPRSVTKALAHALNLHPHVYCAEEASTSGPVIHGSLFRTLSSMRAMEATKRH
jgi:hypothetical protein